MSEYGGYQRQRAHSLGPYTSVYEAAAPDGRPGRFALKIFHPPASTKVRRSYDIAGWLLAAERQQLSARKDGAVLEVVAFGLCAEGAYAVTPWQEHPLEPIVETMAAKGDLLRALAECLLNALEQWGAQTGGSHRKLKASNIFLTHSGPLAGMTVVLTDPWFVFGDKTGPKRVNDLTALGGILAQVVRRREVTAWPIEDGPEWRALGRPGKAWLAYCNYLLNPQPAAGELTLAEARARLRKIPKDAQPVRKALLIGSAALVVAAAGVVAFARFGNPIYMPLNLRKLAETVQNPRAVRENVTPAWALLCRAWDTWLIDLQGNAPRLLQTESLWSGKNDPLRVAIANFNADAKSIMPGTVIPEAAGEKRLGVLGDTPPPAVLAQLKTTRVSDEVDAAYDKVRNLALQLERWPRWEEMRTLLALLKDRGFTRAAGALEPRLPAKPASPGYKLDVVRTLKLFNDVSLDDTGTLLLASRWDEITTLKNHMEGMTEDRIQKRMPELILQPLTDHSSLADFADSLAGPLEQMRRYRREYNDPAVVPERFLKESALLKETADVTTADFPRWEQELVQFSKVPASEDPRLASSLDDTLKNLPATAGDLEADAPAAEPGGLATLSAADFKREFDGLTTSLKSLRGREIVRHDLPAIGDETNKLAGIFHLMEQRLEATLALLKPEIWLGKVAQPYGKFTETKQRWAAWQATLSGVKPADLSRDRPRFRGLRAQERQIRAWIDGLEGPEGLAALVVPDLSKASADTAAALRELENARREQAASAVGVIAEWRNALPVVPWAAAGVAVRAPLESHRQWLVDLPVFAANLDRLSLLLEGGFAWNEGVGEVMDRLAKNPGVDALTGRPAEWNTEAKLLGRLVQSDDRAELVGAAQTGGLSRKFTAWRRLGTLAGWPAGAEDLDVDGGVVSALRATVARDVADEARRDTLLGELKKETQVRWNRAARNSAADEKRLTAVFERMERYGISDADLDAPALYDLNLWRLKRSDWSEVDLAPLKSRRDNFVTAVRAISGVVDQPAVTKFVNDLAGIELVVDPNRAPTPSPKMAGWHEELTDAGLGLTATWQSGGHEVKLDFLVVQPDDATPPFYLARREVAVGEFLDLTGTRPKDTEALMVEMPLWARADTPATPRDIPLAWSPRVDNTGRYAGFELNPTWIPYPTAPVKGLLEDADLRTKTPALDQAAAEKPSLRSPLQMIPPEAAKIFAEKLLGARLPKPAEWQAALRKLGTPASGIFRGANFQRLFEYLRDYKAAGQTTTWRPGVGAFLPRVATPGVASRRKYVDDGKAGGGRADARLWFAPVDEGVATGGFFNLTGNVSIYLYDDAARQFYVAGGSALSPPGIDFAEAQKVEASGEIGAKKVTEGFSDVGIRPAFDAPPGFKERYKLLVLVRDQRYLTW